MPDGISEDASWRWLHGTTVQFQVGDTLLPAKDTGGDVNFPDRSNGSFVHVTPCALRAAQYAQTYPMGFVCEVQCDERPVPEEEYEWHFTVSRATVVRTLRSLDAVNGCRNALCESCPGAG